jgi:hypothetical protein
MPPYKPKFFKNVQNGLLQNRAGGLRFAAFQGFGKFHVIFMKKFQSMYAVVFEWFMIFLKKFFLQKLKTKVDSLF